MLDQNKIPSILPDFGSDKQIRIGAEDRIEDLYSARVQANPDRLAVIDGVQSMSYGELNHRANQLAECLIRGGVAPGDLIGIYLERSIDVFICMLGILKAGAAFLCIDPERPRDYLANLLSKNKLWGVTTLERLAPSWPLSNTKIVCLDSKEAFIRRHPEERRLLPKLSGDELAYVIYTSGTTGEPLGVMVHHRGVVNLARAIGQAQFNSVAQISSLSFDAFIYETFVALLNGATLIMVDRSDLQPMKLAHWLNQQQIDLLTIVPSLLGLLSPQSLHSRQSLVVHCVGEACPVELAREWSERSQFYNAYGPAEATVCTHIWRVTPTALSSGEPVPIGHPLPNVDAYILDGALNQVTEGGTGELCIGGAGVARGYVGMPDITAERFVPDPFSKLAGARLYRTGDLVRGRADGALEFLGRVDTQIKVQGMRIGALEIERILESHGGVKQAVVVAQEENYGRRLAAFLTLNRSYPMPEVDAAHESRWREAMNQVDYESWNGDEEFNIAGWRTSGDRQSVSEAEMREFVDLAAARIEALRPSRALDIGCGTGLLLFKLAPKCQEYWGTDFSGPALDQICKRLSRPPWLQNVTTAYRQANDMSGMEAGFFDLAIMNSVVQYFPNEAYLTSLVCQLSELLVEGGHIFLGDIRPFNLLKAFHCARHLDQLPGNVATAVLSETIEAGVRAEVELLVSPSYFATLPRHNHRISKIRVLPKYGKFDNEFNRFRYDVVLSIGDRPAAPVQPQWFDWQQDGMTIERLQQMLRDPHHECLGVRSIPNSRIHRFTTALQLLEAMPENSSVARLRESVAATRDRVLDPNELRSLASEFGHEAEISWAAGRANGLFDVAFVRKGSTIDISNINFTENAGDAGSCPLSLFCNHPTADQRAAKLMSELRYLASQKVPREFMPSSYTVLEKMPLSHNGKIDRKALSSWSQRRDSPHANRPADSSDPESVIRAVWSELLRVPDVGVHDNFFELGGHSLVAVQAISRINSTLRTILPVRSLFECPTPSQLAKRLESDRKKSAAETLTIRPVEEGTQVSLSFAQKRLFFISQLFPESPVYNMPLQLQFTGRLDVDALSASLHHIVGRHPALRTRIVMIDGSPAQLTDCDSLVSVPVHDLQLFPAKEKEKEKKRIIDDLAFTPINIETGPLLRTALVQLSADESMLLITVHHIAADGWSLGILISELAILYRALAVGHPPNLPMPVMPYASYARWQNEWILTPQAKEQRDWWQARLSGVRPILLPYDRPRPPVQTFRGDTIFSTIPRHLVDRLSRLAAGDNATLFMALLAAFKVLLFRYTGQEDITVGSPVANRDALETEGIVGMLTNNLVLRTEIQSRLTSREVLQRVRTIVLDAYDHGKFPFDKLVEDLRPERDLSRSPLIQVWFAYFNVGLQNITLPGVELQEMNAGAPGSKFDLSLSITDSKADLCCAWEYSTDLFESATISRFIETFLRIVQFICDHPHLPIGTIPLMGPSEAASQVRGPARRDSNANNTVQSAFESWVRKTPDALCAHDRNTSLTYSQLNHRASVLAKKLQNRVKRGDKVAVYLDRSVDILAALLAVLKSGAAYVPLDPAYPISRLEQMLENSRARVLVTEESLRNNLPALAATVLVEDIQEEEVFSSPGINVSGHDLAYVIYTSGSQGVPKGVAITHGSVVNTISSVADRIGAGQATVLLACASISFDMSVVDMFLTISVGGQIFIAEKEDTRDGERLANLVVESGATLMQGTPTQWRVLLTAGSPDLSGLTALSGGEPLSRDLASSLMAKTKRLFNAYGPTETTVWSTLAEVQREDEVICIGRPIANTSCYILDADLFPVPKGVIGDLWIGGDGLSWGFVNKPDQTADSFMPDPFSVTPGARMYRTGDLARCGALDGSLYHVGRSDSQVKVRGYRIELQEIEAILETHPAIERAAAVVVGSEESLERKIVAFYTKTGSDFPYPSELRAFVGNQLPSYMVPASFISLNSFPRTPGGKLDRMALARVKQPSDLSMVEYVAPRTETESQVARIWARVLGCAQVSVVADFFEHLGGHSILVPEIMFVVRSAYHVALPLRSLFETRTVAAFAVRLEAALNDATFPIDIAPQVPFLPASSIQEFLYRRWETNSDWDSVISISAQIDGDFHIQTFASALEGVVGRHAAVRTLFEHREDGILLQKTLGDMPVPLLRRDTSGLSLAETRLLVDELEQDPEYSFDLGKGPLVRAIVFTCGRQRSVLHIQAHRSICDSWSLQGILKEAVLRYDSLVLNRKYELEDCVVHFADFVAWQLKWVEGSFAKSQLLRRIKALQSSLEIASCPADSEKKNGLPRQRASTRSKLSCERTAQVIAFAQSEGVPRRVVLLASFIATLRRRFSSLAVAYIESNRHWKSLNSVVGAFANALVIATELPAGGRVRDFVHSVYEDLLEAELIRDISIVEIAKLLTGNGSCDYGSLLGATFTCVEAPEEPYAVQSLQIQQINAHLADFPADLCMRAHFTSDECIVELDYRVNSLDKPRAKEFLSDFLEFVSTAMVNPDMPWEQVIEKQSK